MTYDGTAKKFYINGELDSSVNYSGAMVQTDYAALIGRPGQGMDNSAYDGYIEEVRIWSLARMQAEISATMNTTLAGATDGLAGYWRFDELTNLGVGGDALADDVEDFSGNGNHGDAVNAAARLVRSHFYGLASEYRVRIDGVGGDGLVKLFFIDNESIKDTARNSFGGPGAQNYDEAEIYTIDTSPPSIDTMQVLDDHTIEVTFNETLAMDPGALDAANYTLLDEGTGTLAAHPDTVTFVDSNALAENIYRLTWSSGAVSPAGNVTITVANMQDTTGFDLVDPLSATDSRGNPEIVSITPITPSPTNAETVEFQVEFSENVTGFTALSLIAMSMMGTASASISSIDATYLPRAYNVILTGVSGDGAISLSVAENAASDALGNLSTGFGPGDELVIDNTLPQVSVDSLFTNIQSPELTGTVDDPVLTVPAAQTTNEDTALVFSSANGNAISINDADVDQAPGELRVSISVNYGELTLVVCQGPKVG